MDFERASDQVRTRLQTEDIYPDSTARPPALNAALSLFHQADGLLGNAISALRAGEAIVSDDYVCQFFGMLPELFCLREIGDGFALAVSSMFHGIQNRAGVPLDEAQLLALAYVIRFLRNEIYCSFDTASELVERLEKAGLEIDPPLLERLADAIDA